VKASSLLLESPKDSPNPELGGTSVKSEVAVLKCPDYDYEKVRETVYSSINMVGGAKSLHISSGDKVLLKVNLLGARKPEDAATTHPTVARALTEYFQDAGAEVVLGDSSAAGPIETRKALKVAGIEQVAKETKSKAVNFEAEGFTKIPAPKGSIQLNEIYVANPVLDAQIVVTVPKLKNHNMTRFTGALKNLFGTVPTATRMNLHALGKIGLFSQGIADIYSAIKPRLAVMDGIVGMDGNGPSYGTIKSTGIIAASRDGVALDAVCSSLVGYKENDILTTVEASNRGLGNGRLKDIQLKGVDGRELDLSWDRVKTMPLDRVPSRLFRTMIRLVYTRPALIKANCTRCATCASHCPAQAIKLNPYPALDYKKCLRCYTCNEICPNGAYELRKSFLARILGRMGIQI
jgi:uncharacterized protein (DUF362 family)/NAD-dependent dihydropyrimidine dehydrogenase PreA subunit